MTRKQFLQFGARWHYPFLVLGSGQVLRHGKDAYESASPVIVCLASKRIERWHALITPERVTEALERVDNLLISRLTEVERVEV